MKRSKCPWVHRENQAKTRIAWSLQTDTSAPHHTTQPASASKSDFVKLTKKIKIGFVKVKCKKESKIKKTTLHITPKCYSVLRCLRWSDYKDVQTGCGEKEMYSCDPLHISTSLKLYVYFHVCEGDFCFNHLWFPKILSKKNYSLYAWYSRTLIN